MKKRNLYQWWAYLDPKIIRLLKRVADKELPDVAPGKRQSVLTRKIFNEWLEWRGYLKGKKKKR